MKWIPQVLLLVLPLGVMNPHLIDAVIQPFQVTPGLETIHVLHLQLKHPANMNHRASCEFSITTAGAMQIVKGEKLINDETALDQKRDSISRANQQQQLLQDDADVGSPYLVDPRHDNNAEKSAQMVLGRLAGVTIRITAENYWRYEINFETEIVQSHGRVSNSLGKYVGMEGIRQVYRGGTACEAMRSGSPTPVGRETKVSFVCDPALRIISVEEVSTCSYVMYVGTPVVCSNSLFKSSLSGLAGGKDKSLLGSGSNKLATTLMESWVLELVEMQGGQVSCKASLLVPYINEDELPRSLQAVTSAGSQPARAGGPYTGIKVSRFELTVKIQPAADEANPQSRPRLEKEYLICRSPLRQRLSPENREYTVMDGGNYLSIKSLDSFPGTLGLVTLQSKLLFSFSNDS